MRRIALWFLSTIAAVTLLFSYPTSQSGAASQTVVAAPAGTAVTAGPTAAAGTGSAGATAGTTGPAGAIGGTTTGTSGPGTSGSAAGTGSAAAATRIVTGSVAQTRWGPVQVRLTVAAGRITDVTVLQYPDGNGRDEQINARALPVLTQETLAAQSAGIDMVSGATVTSEGYVTSLQSALDQAGIA